jgi:hypothetical protein
MSDNLSINPEKVMIELKTNKSDIVTLLIKGIIGAAPLVGPIIAETLSITIPNQKLERLISFTEVLEMKVKNLETAVNENKFKSPEFTDLLEDAMLQASRALSQERIEYIATLISKSLTTDDASHLREKWLLGLLGQLNDAEIIILKYKELTAAHGLYKQSVEFGLKHTEAIPSTHLPLDRIPFTSREELDKEFQNQEFLNAYEGHLEQLGLGKVSPDSVSRKLLQYIGIALDPFPEDETAC